MIRQTTIIRKKVVLFILLALCCQSATLLTGSPSALYAQGTVLRTNTLEGVLPQQSTKHYFGLAPAIRDSWVVVTLAYEPRTDLSLSGLVNFAVLTEDGLRQYLAGADIEQASIASGGRVPYDRVGNKLQASFKDSGRGEYTVIVYNNSAQSVRYTLGVEGGDLIDEIGQAVNGAGAQADAQPEANSAGETTQTAAAEPVAALPYPAVRALRVTSSLGPTLGRHYLTIEPDTSNSIISLNMQYGPLNEPALDYNVNFYVLTEDGLRRLVHGDRPENVNVAVGFPSPYPDKPNELLAGFQAGGRGPYMVVISNRAALAVNYQMTASQAVLVDQYGQTNEAQAAQLEYAAIQNAQGNVAAASVVTSAVAETNTPIATDSNLIRASATINTATAQRTFELQNQFNLPYQHHYYGVEPAIANGRIQVTLAYALTAAELSVNPPNFWVLDEDGLRRVISGARPMDVNIANGAIVPNGADEGKLRATFDASGKGPYTLVIDNNANSSAAYHVRISGGFLTQPPADSEQLLVLP
ncbi:MAG: hypothetical protein R3A44_03715 [Caldilineaceae bacterium]